MNPRLPHGSLPGTTLLLLLGLMLLPGCPTDDDDAADDDASGDDDDLTTDADGDGYVQGLDCDDGDPEVYPGAPEQCDGEDDDCDGVVDNGLTEDLDGDGHSTPESCEGTRDDCDDGDPLVYPGAEEICDGADSDCDGGLPPIEEDHDGDGDVACADCNDAADWLNYADADGDGFATCEGDCDDGDPGLDPADLDGDGWSTCDGDCDDGDDTLDLDDGDLDGWTSCDGDCDDADPSLGPADLDGDGWSTCDGDCDDGTALSHPGATEICDGQDNDCDGVVFPHELDADGDGWPVCAGDCNDVLATVYPGAPADCDGVADNDCDGIDDPDELDADGDGATPCDGDCDDGDAALDPWDADGDGWTTCDGDCDDGEGAVHPAQAEVCSDGVDNDCDGGPGDCGIYGELSPADADAVIRGTSWSFLSGERGLAPGVDADGDGQADILAGAYGDNEAGISAGAAYLWLAPFSGELDTTDATAKLTAEAAGDGAGYAVTAGGDADGDGEPDLVIAAPWHDAGAYDRGAVYIVTSLPSGTDTLALAEIKLVGAVDEDRAGVDVEYAGDLDGDGQDDLVVGVPNHDPGNDPYAGAAAVLYGPLAGEISLADADAMLIGTASDAHAGSVVASAGDVNGDGLDDLLVGSPLLSTGRAYLVHGPVYGEVELLNADETWSGISWPEVSEVGHPQGLAGVGDVNGDGLDDFAVGEWRWGEFGDNYMGRASLFLGPYVPNTSLDGADFHLYGTDDWSTCGSHVTGAGDVNGDGIGDLLVGCREFDVGGGQLSDEGAAALVYGPLGGTLHTGDLAGSGHALLLGEDYNDEAGQVRPAGDVNGDGYDDVLVASADAGPWQGGGSIYVWFGGEM